MDYFAKEQQKRNTVYVNYNFSKNEYSEGAKNNSARAEADDSSAEE
jgi:hypothetical protein